MNRKVLIINISEKFTATIENYFSKMKLACVAKEACAFDADSLNSYVEEEDVAIVIIESNSKSEIKKALANCRNLRVPYIILKQEHNFSLNSIAMPITFLAEEAEKAPFAAALAKHFDSHIYVYSPKDYGSRAQKTVDRSIKLLESMSLKFSVVNGQTDSFSIEKEVAKYANKGDFDSLIITASREYGLDDIIFGSKEHKILYNSKVPVILINPRGDLYALCQ